MTNKDLEKITRLEVIDESGRRYVNWHVNNLELSSQDDGKTLKIFVNCNLKGIKDDK